MEKRGLFTKLENNRIILKKHDENLAATMFEYVERDRERLGQYLPWVPYVKTIQDEVNFIQKTHQDWENFVRFDFGIFRKTDDVYLGNIGVHSISWNDRRCEIGYWILGEYEGQGYISESVRTIEQHLFNQGFHRIEIRCSSTNEKSASVPIACGYIYDGYTEEDAIELGAFRNTKKFSKLATRYLKPHISRMTTEDLQPILKIAHQLPQFFTAKGLELIRIDLQSQKGFVYRSNDRIVGFITYFSNQGIGEIGWMGVLPDHQSQGLGSKLLQNLKLELIKNNCRTLVVKTLDESVDYKPYEKTRKFYLKNGFQKSHIIHHPENPEYEAELVLKMDL